MPTSEARINANKLNAARSTGPKTEEGKERSRANSLKHGMTGEGIVLSVADSFEVERRSVCFVAELNATGEVEISLARRAALNSVRMERGAIQEMASLSVRVRQAEADFVAPEGVTDEEVNQLRTEAGRIALFDPSKEACRARTYEAAAQRAFFRALKDLRQIQKQANAQPKMAGVEAMNAAMGSFLEIKKESVPRDAEFDEIFADYDRELPRRSAHSPQIARSIRGIDVPISVGRAR